MGYCVDCYREGLLYPMIAQGEEEFNGKTWIILECILGCGGSIRTPKTVKEEEKDLN